MNLNIVLYQPEIPQNTGNIGRTCILTNSNLHIIKPMGFSVSDKYLKRAGMDYWKKLDVIYYEDFEDFYLKHKADRVYLSTTRGAKCYSDITYKDNDYILFGRESCGVTDEIRKVYKDFSIKIPIIESSDRSLNLSNSVAIVAYEALRQNGFAQMK